ncbi:MAG: CPBP family intramembrane metalloprotease [Algoriphagus sp.]|uniref:CPBP family intramembrane glutamic endopeptidase n=1 Tax=Algoriphagus sp. TaxID=1872435 RepID=UPI0027317D80|nr:CPBP family intramembrane glutamic endopeptidase [Algoriphagus sp.]MDP2040245.1 CPBP family intramembrane metalloprotease [Algoriphagus sp.]MDP3471365.1 CPBP family intramembrane metalloprotease [Algoriphagus sp.]
MEQHSKLKSIIFHLYPGLIIVLFFGLSTPYFLKLGLPPQLSMLTAILVVVIPLFLIHLNQARKLEKKESIRELISYTNELPTARLIGYVAGLIVFAFLVYGLTQPLNVIISNKLLFWLPEWYKVQDFTGYSKTIILITLLINLIFNGLIAPFLEEIYFRGYLLPRMRNWGNFAPLVNTILFSLYHFWQPQIYLTLMIALFPMTYLVWKTRSLKLGIYTHCGLNIIGAILSFGLIN